MSKIISYTQWSDYLEQCATMLIALSHTPDKKHYYEFDSAFTGIKLNAPALIGIPPSGKITDSKSDNIQMDMVGEFLVVMPCGPEDFAAQLAVYDSCLEIGWDIITKFYKDLREFVSPADKAINFLDPSNVTFQPVGPEFENHFGIHFFVPFSNPRSLNYNAAKFHP